MDISEVRKKIDKIDDSLKTLFEERMSVMADIADCKKESGKPVGDSKREREIINRVTEDQDDRMATYTKIFYQTLFDLSKSYQTTRMSETTPLIDSIRAARADASELFPASATVACQGMEGANAQLACEKLFARPKILYFNGFDGIFSAVEQGLCTYGILPIENSIYGSVTAVYDLMHKHNFYIVRSIKLKIDHVLMAKPGVKLEDIKEIISHEQALGQCSEYLKGLKGVKLTPFANTALAAAEVSSSERRDLAVLADRSCAELYGLSVIEDDVQNNGNNYTRFLCIAKDMKIYAGASKMSLLIRVPHKPGSLYGMMSKFAALGVNLTKLESRPIPGTDFAFLFYLEADASAWTEDVLTLLASLSMQEQLTFLGCYTEL